MISLFSFQKNPCLGGGKDDSAFNFERKILGKEVGKMNPLFSFEKKSLLRKWER